MESRSRLFEENCERWAVSSIDEAAFLMGVACDRVSFSDTCPGKINLRGQDTNGAFTYYSKDPETETKAWFSGLDLRGIYVLYVYGVGLGYGYEASKEWLKGEESRSVVFIEDDPQVIRLFFETERAVELLHDRQAALHFISDPFLSAQTITRPYSLFPFKVSFLNVYASRRPQECCKIKAGIDFFTDFHHSADSEFMQGGTHFFYNYFHNILKLPISYNAESLVDKFKGVPAIICGAGPSLDKNIDVLKTLNHRALILAGGTAINALNAKGIIPHIGVGIDPNPTQLTRLILNQGYEMPFFFRSRIHHRALEMMHGDKLFVSGSSGYEVGNWVQKELSITGVDPGEGHNVLNFALSLAQMMGCNPILTVGIDLAYSQGQSYASLVESHPLHNTKVDFRTKASDEDVIERKDIYGRPVRTLWKWVRESIWYARFAESHPDVHLINATEGGIGFPDVENKSLAEASSQHLVHHYDLATRLHGEIQNCKWPADLDAFKIETVMVQLSESLKRCVAACARIEKQLASSKENDFRENCEEDISKLHEEKAYQAMLEDVDKAFLQLTGLERHRLKVGVGLISDEEAFKIQMKLTIGGYRFLKETAHCNSCLIDSILKNFKEKKKPASLELNAPTPVTIDKGVDDAEGYVFKDQYLTLRDPELELDYSETFPTGSYLHKEQLYYPDGSLKVEQCYQGGCLHGPVTFFSQMGNVLARAWYIHGKQQGKMWTYYTTSALHSLERFRDGNRQGKQEYFYPNGALKTSMSYSKGLLDGEVTLYHPSGIPSRKLTAIMGKREGKECLWNEKGELTIEVEFHNDRPVGVAREWHSTGQLASEIIYDEDSKRLSAKFWRLDGTLFSEDEFDQKGYFERVIRRTGNFTDSLHVVLSEVSKLIPNFAAATKGSTNIQLNKEIADDLKSLQDEMTHLQELGQALQKESASEDTQESFLNSGDQQAFEQQLILERSKMGDQMQAIDKGLKEMLKVFMPKNEDDKKDG